MNVSVAGVPATAAARVSTSRRTAPKSFQAIGPSQAGRENAERVLPVTRAQYSGKSRASVHTVVTLLWPPNPVTRSLMYVA